MWSSGSEKEKPPTYSQFKKKYFNKYKEKLRNDLTNIRMSSLNYEDKHKLLTELQNQIIDTFFLIKK